MPSRPPAPPVGTSLGKFGVNLGQFVQAFNDRTKEYNGTPIPVIVTVYNDRSFDFITKSPPAASMLKQAAGIAKGSFYLFFASKEDLFFDIYVGKASPGDTGSGNLSDTVPDACRTDCSPAGCGDGVADTGEQCDGADDAACPGTPRCW